MTGDQARQCVEIARATIDEWKAKLLPTPGQGVIIDGRTVTVEPAAVPVVARPVRTIMLHVWAEITMTQSMADVVTLPPEYDESGTYVYPVFLVASLALSAATSGYTWGTPPEVLPDAGDVANAAGELLQGGLWNGSYFLGTGPGYDIEIGDLSKTAVVTLYLRGRYLEDADYQSTIGDAASFEKEFNVGRRTVGTLLTGDRASPLPSESQTGEVRIGYAGTTFNLTAISRGAYPDAPLTSTYCITSLSRN